MSNLVYQEYYNSSNQFPGKNTPFTQSYSHPVSRPTKAHPQELAEPADDVGHDRWEVRRELEEVDRHL